MPEIGAGVAKARRKDIRLGTPGRKRLRTARGLNCRIGSAAFGTPIQRGRLVGRNRRIMPP
jgi:hypothetical protein